MPTARARYQSAGAVNIETRSPRPARFIADGASASDRRRRARSTSGQRLGDVRLTPSTQQHRLVVGEAVDARGRLHDHVRQAAASSAATALPMSASVPEPTVTIAAAPATAAHARVATVASSAWTPPDGGPSRAPGALRVGARAGRSRAPSGRRRATHRRRVGEQRRPARAVASRPATSGGQRVERVRAGDHPAEPERAQAAASGARSRRARTASRSNASNTPAVPSRSRPSFIPPWFAFHLSPSPRRRRSRDSARTPSSYRSRVRRIGTSGRPRPPRRAPRVVEVRERAAGDARRASRRRARSALGREHRAHRAVESRRP